MNKSNGCLFTMLFLATFVSLAACQVSSSEPTNTFAKSGLEIILEADLTEGQELPAGSLDTAREIVERRVKGLGVAEASVQTRGTRRIIVELPGIDDPDLVNTLGQTGLLEFIDAGYVPLPPGTPVRTTFSEQMATPVLTDTGTLAGTGEISPTEPLFSEQGPVYETVFTERDLKRVGLRDDQTRFSISFEMQPDAAEEFAEYTGSHIGQYLVIVLDGEVISSPIINSAITDGQGYISGDFSYQAARSLAILLQYGTLPSPFKVVQVRTIP